MVSIRPAAAPLLIALAAATAANAQEMTPQEISHFLQKAAAAAGQGFAAHYEELRHVPLLSEPIRETGRIEFQPPLRLRKEARQPEPNLVLCDGKTFWLVFPQQNEAEAYPLARHPRVRESVESLAACLDPAQVPRKFRLTGSRTEYGIRLSLTPKTPALRQLFSRAELEMTPTGQPRNLRWFGTDGSFTHIRFQRVSPPTLPPSAFSPPPHTRLFYPLGP